MASSSPLSVGTEEYNQSQFMNNNEFKIQTHGSQRFLEQCHVCGREVVAEHTLGMRKGIDDSAQARAWWATLILSQPAFDPLMLTKFRLAINKCNDRTDNSLTQSALSSMSISWNITMLSCAM
ncbi:uncharacterized protein EAE98_003193 [Botrytis deweyae]|uniref:Uncharacterized protein n=1 Tax=Botrytis deweyae TaxID=2478750 RepID=A0ABQ7IVW4_9HELO|nr:uncharacterized protein EAE98_003193 [Botrytis deweyae]KAF7935148.1 hypothetical protein EAE98_003193 [Botrytis deweyae]